VLFAVQCICVYCMILVTRAYSFPKPTLQVGFCNGNRECSLWGRNYFFYTYICVIEMNISLQSIKSFFLFWDSRPRIVMNANENIRGVYYLCLKKGGDKDTNKNTSLALRFEQSTFSYKKVLPSCLHSCCISCTAEGY
jgi:hypothetical protein